MTSPDLDRFARRIASRRTLLAGFLGLLATSVGSRRVQAAAGMTLSRTSGRVGQSVTASLTGFAPGNVVRIVWYDDGVGRKIKEGITIDGSGKATATFKIPYATRGVHTVKALGGSGAAPSGTVDVITSVVMGPSRVGDGQKLTMRVTGYRPYRYVAPSWYDSCNPGADYPTGVWEYFPTGKRGSMSTYVTVDRDVSNWYTCGKHRFEARDYGPSQNGSTFLPPTTDSTRIGEPRCIEIVC